MKKPKAYLFLLLILSSVRVAAEDVAGSSDHPLLTRFPGSVIAQYDHKEYDEIAWCAKYRCKETESVEGRTTRITYTLDEVHSTLEVLKSYERALQKAGFEAVFSCSGQRTIDDCPTPSNYLELPGESPIGRGERFYADNRRLTILRRGSDYVSVYAYRGLEETRARVRIVEGEELASDLVVVDAEAISSSIESSGSIALYGVLFDTDSAALLPASQQVLGEVATYLTTRSETRLLVVGHTDNTGTFDHNMDLSKRRAEAVVEHLVSTHSIERSRLAPVGAGPIAPVASNSTEDGKGKNRRVQLVEM